MPWSRIVLSTLVLALAGHALAMQENLTSEEITARADRIVRAEVTSQEIRWAGTARGDLETVVWVSVEETLKGTPQQAFAVVLAGGRRGDLGAWVPDEPTLLTDHRYELALVRDDLGRWRVLNGPGGATPLDPLPCYQVNGIDWSHQAHPVEEDFKLNVNSFSDSMTSDEALEEAFTLALDQWNHEGEAAVYAPYGGHTTDTHYGSDNHTNLTLYTASTWGSALALATYYYMGNGQMTDCDVEFYGSNNGGSLSWHFDVGSSAPSNAFDFTHVAMHELGHCLGLGHSSHAAAIMYAYSSPGSGETARHLHSDDKAGLQAIYGTGSADVVVDDAWFEPSEGADDGDDALDRDEVYELHVTLRNQGSATAVDVLGYAKAPDGWVKVDPDPVPLGDLPPGAAGGSIAEELVFPLTLLPGCDEDGSVELYVEMDDANGNEWSSDSWTLLYECDGPAPGDHDDDDDDGHPFGGGVEPEGCSCATPPGEGGLARRRVPVLLGLLAGVAWATWRRGRRD